MSVSSLFRDSAVRKLRQLNERIGTCLGKLSPGQIWWRGGQNENAVGNLVLHLAGNVRQWILAGLGGQPDHRVRDREFSAHEGLSPAELMALLSGTVDEAAALIAALGEDQLTRMYEIQNYRVSGLEVVLHVVEHFSYHAGQIIFATKAMTGEDPGFYRHLNDTSHSEKTP